MLINAILASMIVSAISLAGAVSFVIKKKVLHKFTLLLVAFSTGALLGGAFLHLLPEAMEGATGIEPFVYVLMGIVVFFVVERILLWNHCHNDADHKCKIHTFSYMSLIGDGIHNFIDGLIIVSAFSIDSQIGLATTIAIASHELPQELGDFAVLVHGGLTNSRALFLNLMSSLTAIFGVVIGYFLVNGIESVTQFLLPFAAGGFIYVSMSDLIPELHKEKDVKKSIMYMGMFIIGLVFMWSVKILFE